jgi:DNA-binding MarR family transcriptional regulator
MAARITGRCTSSIARTGTTVNNLLAILGVTKQSLNRVLRTLIEDGLVESRVGSRDKRERHLYLTDKGARRWSGSCPRRSATGCARPIRRRAGGGRGLSQGARGDDGWTRDAAHYLALKDVDVMTEIPSDSASADRRR